MDLGFWKLQLPHLQNRGGGPEGLHHGNSPEMMCVQGAGEWLWGSGKEKGERPAFTQLLRRLRDRGLYVQMPRP